MPAEKGGPDQHAVAGGSVLDGEEGSYGERDSAAKRAEGGARVHSSSAPVSLPDQCGAAATVRVPAGEIFYCYSTTTWGGRKPTHLTSAKQTSVSR